MMGGFQPLRVLWCCIRRLTGRRSNESSGDVHLEMLAEQRQILVPSRLRVVGPFDLQFHQLPDHQLRLSASSQAQLQAVSTVVSQGTLVIEVDPGAHHAFEHQGRVVVGIAAPQIAGVAAGGDAIVSIADIDVDALEIHGADSSEVSAGGRCRHLTVSAGGMSSIDCEALVTSQADCHITKNASCRTFALDSIRAQVSGHASLAIGGRPRREEIAIADDGYVSRLWGAAGEGLVSR
ncbi:GIN domain-containing protein [Cupriavidus metallidurans]|jgi:Putative auto-transporter adhesin, head GIN domain|uniref:GIN domain-containing protein n=2 Tax=Burkholderiaceae TaxID=119060 RepID=UPI001362CCE9|nr:DUF2807 domain-containing protein [Cupriavidus sp.]